ncbi:MAG: 2-oxo acid dehydrogenase subunit E2 [Desulfobacterales bacterium]|nr:2-oxo acid dehydrogenase subunit E2 [Desulfobacterales bacterium]
MRKDVTVPEISENVTSGKVVEVLVEVGDRVAVDDVLLEMETEKAVVEIPSPYAGVVSEILVEAGGEARVGEVIARIEVTEGEDDGEGGEEKRPRTPEPVLTTDELAAAIDARTPPQEEDVAADRQAVAAAEGDAPREAHKAPAFRSEDRRAGRENEHGVVADDWPLRPAPAAPSVRRLARELGVDIHAVKGSGHDGRISAADVHAHVKQRLTAAAPTVRLPDAGGTPPPLPDFSRWGPVRTVKLETVRRLTAENTSTAWRLIPHVTQFDEADITELQPFIERHAREAEKQDGKLTITAVAMKACAAALMRFPQFNASIDLANDQLIYKDHVHVGLAVDTPRGLLVPVVRNVQDKGIIDLAVEISDMARRARAKKIKPDELEGATFTISNQGGIGGVNFTPVVVWPQAAILGLSRSRRMPRERDGQFVARNMLPLSLSYDHRIADGADAARFLDWIARGLEQGLTLLL